MGLTQSPKLVTDGLIFNFDMQNAEKSYKGIPITNQFLVPTPDSSNNVTFSVQGTGTFKRVFEGTYGGYSINSSDVVYRYDLGGAGCHYHGNDTTITSGYYATWQFDYFISSDASALVTDYLANMENTGSGTGGAVTVGDNTKIGKWNSVRYTVGPATSTAGLRLLLYPGSCSSSYLTANGYILFKNPAVWYTSFSPTANIPFVSGTRSTAQSILDPIGKNTITVVGTPTFNTDRLTIPNTNSSYLDVSPSTNFKMGTQDFTISAWVKQLDNSANTITEARDGSTLQGYFFCLNYPSAGQIGFFVNPSTGQAVYSTSVATLGYNVVQNITAVVKRSNATIELYVNGSLYDTITGIQTASISGTGDMYRIGYDRGGATTNMDIYAYSHYNRALSLQEVQQNFNALRGRYGI